MAKVLFSQVRITNVKLINEADNVSETLEIITTL